MRQRDLETLFDFSYWVRDRVLAQAAKLSVADFCTPSGVTIRGLRETLVHTLDVEWSWRLRLQGAPEDVWKKELVPEDYATVAALADHWRQDEREMRSWLAGLDDERLERIHQLTPTTAADRSRRAVEHPLWYYVMHIHTHTHQQLSDASVILTRMRQSPGNIEFLEYAEHANRRAATPAD